MLYIYDNQTLQYRKISLKKYIITILITVVIFSSLGFTAAIKFNNFIEKIPVLIKEEPEKLSKEYVLQLLEECKVQNKDIVWQQISLETGNLTSQSCLKGKNLTGMKRAYTRQNCQNGEYLNHAMYKSYKESVLDYALFQAKYCDNLTKEQYYSFLQQYYAENPNYVKLLKQIK